MRFKNGLLITIVMITAYLATDIYVPSLPAIASGLHTTKSLAQSTLSVYLLGMAIAQFTYGILSDKYGRKPMLIIGLSIFLIGSVVTLFATSINILLLGRLIQGLGIGSSASLGRVLLRDLYQGKELFKMISYIVPTIFIVPAFAPVIGGFLQEYFGYHGSFALMLFYGIFALSIILLFLPETNLNRNKHAIKLPILISNFKLVVSCKKLMVNLLSAGLGFSLVVIFSAANPFLLQNELHVSSQNYGLLTLVMSSSLAIGVFINGKIINYFKIDSIILFGYILVLCSGLITLVYAQFFMMSIQSVIIPTFIALFGVSFIGPNSGAKVFQFFPGIAGFVGAIYGASQVLMSSFGGVLASILRGNNQEHIALLITALGLFGLVIRVLNLRSDSVKSEVMGRV